MQTFAPLVRDTRAKINRTTSILFLVQLFGALGAGFFFFVQNILGGIFKLDEMHMLGALERVNEPILWFIMFWGTDFFMIAMTAVLCYLIAGLPGLTPGLALSIYFAHFAGAQPVQAEEGYFAFFATPLRGGGGVNIGYLGYFFMAVFCALLIKMLYAGWDALKKKTGKLEKIIEQVDLIVLILIIPVCAAALTFVLVRYGIQKPMGLFGPWAQEALLALADSNIWLVGLLFGLMAGFDVVGPVSMTAFGAAAAAFLSTGDARLLTIYGVCFITVGWAPPVMVILSKLLKKPVTDSDDLNIAVSGPINAIFENIKLTAAFSMPFAMRAPLAVIPGLMAGSGFAGLVTALSGIVNTSYATELPKYALGKTMAELLERGEMYLSFTLPLRSGDWLRCRIPLFFIIIAGGLVGGAVMYFLRLLQVKGQKKRDTYVEPKGDIVLEMRELAHARRQELGGRG